MGLRKSGRIYLPWLNYAANSNYLRTTTPGEKEHYAPRNTEGVEGKGTSVNCVDCVDAICFLILILSEYVELNTGPEVSEQLQCLIDFLKALSENVKIMNETLERHVLETNVRLSAIYLLLFFSSFCLHHGKVERGAGAKGWVPDTAATPVQV